MNVWTRAFACGAVTLAVVPAVTPANGQRHATARTPVVLVVGCARPSSEPQIWELIQAGAAAESARPGITTEEKAQLGTRPLGQNTYRLIGVADFVDVESSRKIGVRGEILSPSRVNTTAMLVSGHKVAVKGLYIEGTPARINLTSVVDLGPGCP
jgi:hypothetical protein